MFMRSIIRIASRGLHPAAARLLDRRDPEGLDHVLGFFRHHAETQEATKAMQEDTEPTPPYASNSLRILASPSGPMSFWLSPW
jgi:hypothetical protein